MKKKLTIVLLLFLCMQLLISCRKTSPDTGSIEKSNLLLTQQEIEMLYIKPEDYKGRLVELTGKIFLDVKRDTKNVYFQMYQDIANIRNNTVVAYADQEFSINKGDYVRVKGRVVDGIKGEKILDAEMSAPRILAESVEVISYKDIFAPTLKEIRSGEVIDQYGYNIALEKVELAEKETRVYLAVNNNGNSKFTLYSFSSVIMQDGEQYEIQNNWEADYPEIQSEFDVGEQSEGIICFPPIKASDFKIIFKGNSHNWDEQIKPYEFNVSIQ